MSSKNAKNANVLAENPLDALVGFGLALPTRKAKAVDSDARLKEQPQAGNQQQARSETAAKAPPVSRVPPSSARDHQRATSQPPNSTKRTLIEPSAPGVRQDAVEETVKRVHGVTEVNTTNAPAAAATSTADPSIHSAAQADDLAVRVHVREQAEVLETRDARREVNEPSAQVRPPSTDAAERSQGRAVVANDRDPVTTTSSNAPKNDEEPVTAAVPRMTEREDGTARTIPMQSPAAEGREAASSTRAGVDAKLADEREPRATATLPGSRSASQKAKESASAVLQATVQDAETAGADDSDEGAEFAGRGASFRHRIGTIQEPYVRADGTKVRQWSITLPHELIRRVSHLALDRGVKPASLAQLALERLLAEEGGNER